MSYYAVIDIEMCKVSKNMRSEAYPWAMETIQIGAVLLDESLNIVRNFNQFVHPEHGQIDTFVRKLTSINPSDIQNAPGLKEVIADFLDWLPPQETKAVSWSKTDKNQLAKESESKGITDPRLTQLFDTWIDCQKTFSEKMDTNRIFPLREALMITDVITEGHEHDGFDDARNTALLFIKMMKEDKLQINPLYTSAREEKSETLGYGLESLFANIKLDQ